VPLPERVNRADNTRTSATTCSNLATNGPNRRRLPNKALTNREILLIYEPTKLPTWATTNGVAIPNVHASSANHSHNRTANTDTKSAIKSRTRSRVYATNNPAPVTAADNPCAAIAHTPIAATCSSRCPRYASAAAPDHPARSARARSANSVPAARAASATFIHVWAWALIRPGSPANQSNA
jgi:hypothetical protein